MKKIKIFLIMMLAVFLLSCSDQDASSSTKTGNEAEITAEADAKAQETGEKESVEAESEVASPSVASEQETQEAGKTLADDAKEETNEQAAEPAEEQAEEQVVKPAEEQAEKQAAEPAKDEAEEQAVGPAKKQAEESTKDQAAEQAKSQTNKEKEKAPAENKDSKAAAETSKENEARHRVNIAKADVKLDASELVYNGNKQKPEIRVTYDGNILVQDKDYTLDFSNNKNAGTNTAKVVITGWGDFEGSIEKSFSIARAEQKISAENLSLKYRQKGTIVVSGVKESAALTYKSADTTIAGVDKTGRVTTRKKGSTKITVKAAQTANYKAGKTTVTVKISAAQISKKGVTLSKTSLVYNGKAQKPSVTVKYAGKKLIAGTDYSTSYGNNTNVGKGTAKVTVTGKGNYKGSVTKTFSITQAAQPMKVKASEKVTVATTTKVKVSGAKGSKTFKSSNNKIATVDSSGKVTAKRIGTVKITVASKATKNYKAASKTVTIKVVPGATAFLTANNINDGIRLVWKKVPGATGYRIYRDSDRIKTIEDANTVRYIDTHVSSKNGHKYRYKVRAVGSSGSSDESKSVKIYRLTRTPISSLKNTGAGEVTVKWDKNSKSSGYQIEYSLKKEFDSGNEFLTVKKSSTNSKVIKGLKKGKTYYVRVRAYKNSDDKKYYSAWAAAKAVKITK